MPLALAVLPDHGFVVYVPTIVWKRTSVVTCSVKLRPANKTESVDAFKIREKTCGLLSVDLGVLALVPRDTGKTGSPPNGLELR